ncbi:MAG: zinc metalloprotease HtpX [Elusimicrobia bacterium]|nr:zinc metalloprotease HtpX [Elusimicrobiota bacterium]
MNQMKTFLLMLGLTALLLFLGEMAGGRSGIMMGLGFAVVSNLIAFFFSDKIVLAMYRAKPVTEKDEPKLVQMVRELAERAKIPMPKVYVIPGQMANAFATGRNPQNAAVAVTEGIMQILTPRELRGVLAHEISHVLHRDILIATIAAILAGAVYTLARIVQWGAYFGGGRRDDDRGGNPLALLVVAIVAPLAAMLIQMAVSRSREYEADKGGGRLTDDPLALSQALVKIHQASRYSGWQPNPTTAHLFIANPLKGEGLLSLFSTHPPLSARVARLEAMSQAMGQAAVSAQKGPNFPKLVY